MSRSSIRRRWLSAALAGVVTAGLTVVSLTATTPVAHAATIDPNAYYQLISRHSGKAIDVEAKSTADGARVVQWTPNSGQNQQFRFVPSGDGYYRIMARHSGKVLDVFEWNPNDGAEIRQWPDLNGTNQQFRVVDSAGGYVRFINRFSGKALDVWGGLPPTVAGSRNSPTWTASTSSSSSSGSGAGITVAVVAAASPAWSAGPP